MSRSIALFLFIFQSSLFAQPNGAFKIIGICKYYDNQNILVQGGAFFQDYNDFTFENLVAEDLMKMVQSMPNGYKMIFNLFAIEGYSHAEIADTLGISENTSKSQYSRARAYLKERLEKMNNGR